MSKKNSNELKRDWSWSLPVVCILIMCISIVGIIAYVGEIRENARQKTIDEYNASIVEYTVLGKGEYKEENKVYLVEFETIEEDYKLEKELLERGILSIYDGNRTSIEVNNLEAIQFLSEEFDYEYTYSIKRNDPFKSISAAYDKAYEEALQKATMIASNTNLRWKITNVTEMDSFYDDKKGVTYSTLSITLDVNGNE